MDRLTKYIELHIPLINQALDKRLPRADDSPQVLAEAMRYTALAGAKRMRPLLCLMSAEACGGSAEAAMPAACALEMVHTYSLIHDDLPAMDNDDMRRGRLTCHKAFDEATAILAGDALLTLAFETLAGAYPAEPACGMVLSLSRAAGVAGMVGGQVMDMEGENEEPSLSGVQAIHARKTGALITASCELGAIVAAAGEKEQEALAAYGRAFGMLFQITDDVLDVEASSEDMGKTTGKDAARHKMTYPAVMSVKDAKELARQHAAQAKKAIEPFGKQALMLRLLADYVVERKK